MTAPERAESDTPETDAFIATIESMHASIWQALELFQDHARKLERRLNAALANREVSFKISDLPRKKPNIIFSGRSHDDDELEPNAAAQGGQSNADAWLEGKLRIDAQAAEPVPTAPEQRHRPDGGKVDTEGLNPPAETRAGSTPALGTTLIPLLDAINEPCKGCGKRPIDFLSGAAPAAPDLPPEPSALRFARDFSNIQSVAEIVEYADLLLAAAIGQYDKGYEEGFEAGAKNVRDML